VVLGPQTISRQGWVSVALPDASSRLLSDCLTIGCIANVFHIGSTSTAQSATRSSAARSSRDSSTPTNDAHPGRLVLDGRQQLFRRHAHVEAGWILPHVHQQERDDLLALTRLAYSVPAAGSCLREMPGEGLLSRIEDGSDRHGRKIAHVRRR
jgi:hypothetical protein